MDSSNGFEIEIVLEDSNGFEVLEGDGFVVLGAAGEDIAGGGDGGEGRVEPLGGLGPDGVEVGVEEEGGERWVRARPGEE